MKRATPSLGSVRATLATLAVAAPAALASDPAIVPVQVVLEGDAVAGVGAITSIDNLAVNGQGDWLIEADTNNADTNIDSVVLGWVGLEYQEGQALVLPAGSSLDSFDALTLNEAGDTAWNLFLNGTTGTNDDTGIYRNGDLVLQEGTLSLAPGFSAGTPYIGFFETRYNDNEQILVIASVDDPVIASTVDRALVIFQVDGTGALLSETLVAKEGDVLPGQAFAAADFGTGPHNFAFNDAGDVMFFVDTVDPVTAADGAIYLNSTVLAQEAGPSPIAARPWLSLSSSVMDLSDNGLHTVFRGQLAAPTTDDQLVVLDGAEFIQEGDTLPDIAPFLLTAFGTGALRVTNGGDVVWIGDWDDPVTTQDVGLFYNHQLLVQEGVTTIGGLLVESIATVQDNFAVSADGRYVLFEATLAGGLNGAFLIDRGPWQDQGGADAGTNGNVRLLGSGSLEAGDAVSLTVDRALADAPAVLVLGASRDNLPFNGGVLVPHPDLLVLGLMTDSAGELFLSGTWPADVPSGFSLYAQVFVTDAGAVGGLAGSNGVLGTTP